MNRKLSCTLAGACSMFLLGSTNSSWACGQSSLAITNFPANAGSGFQVNDLNSAGQMTGLFYPPGVGAPRPFLYSGAAVLDLGGLGGYSSQGFVLNALGLVAGEADTPDGLETHPVLFSNGAVLDLGTLGGGYGSPTAINNAGQVAGFSFTADYALEAFLYADGAIRSLGTLGGDYSWPNALNNAGVVAGEASLASGDTHAFVFSGGAIQDLGTLGGTFSTASALNDAGIVVGQSALPNGEMHAFFYANGALQDLGTLGGPSSSAVAINQAGQVIGTSTTADGQAHGFIYANGALTDLGTLGGECTPSAINKFGQVVGRSVTPSGAYHAFLWQDGNLVDLNSFLPADSGWELLTADFVNDKGRVVGSAIHNNASEYFILDLLPANTPPVAIADPDQVVDCQAQAVLQGLQSQDPDGDPLAYEWSLAGYVIGTNPVLAAWFPLGTNVVTLKVTDPCGASAQTNVLVSVTDSAPPALIWPALPPVAADSNCQAAVPNLLAQASATDNCTAPDALVLVQDPLPGALRGVGRHTIAVTAVDNCGNRATTNVVFEVVDTTAPVIRSITATPNVLSPPNHAMIPVSVSLKACDSCDTAPAAKIVSITCNEVLSPGEVQITGSLTALLAASRDGAGRGRVYTLSIACTDNSGNTSTGTVTVTVPQGNGSNSDTATPSTKKPKKGRK